MIWCLTCRFFKKIFCALNDTAQFHTGLTIFEFQSLQSFHWCAVQMHLVALFYINHYQSFSLCGFGSSFVHYPCPRFFAYLILVVTFHLNCLFVFNVRLSPYLFPLAWLWWSLSTLSTSPCFSVIECWWSSFILFVFIAFRLFGFSVVRIIDHSSNPT